MINATWFGIGPSWKVSNIKSFIYNSTEERRRYNIWATVIKSAIIKAERPGFMLGFQDFQFTLGTYLFWVFPYSFRAKIILTIPASPGKLIGLHAVYALALFVVRRPGHSTCIIKVMPFRSYPRALCTPKFRKQSKFSRNELLGCIHAFADDGSTPKV